MSKKQRKEWLGLYRRLKRLLKEYGKEDRLSLVGDSFIGDYFLVDDNWGGNSLKVEIHSLVMLQPVIVKSLQELLRYYPGWHIFVQVDVPGTEGKWPPMSLFVFVDKVQDGLEREYFPKEFRDLNYEGAVPLFDDPRERDRWAAEYELNMSEIMAVPPGDKKGERAVVKKIARRMLRQLAREKE